MSETRKVDFALTVGNLTESVTVDAQPTILETEEGRISGQIDAKQMRELPVPNRNVFNLLSLQPGVSGRTLTNNTAGGSSTPQINANGQRVDANSFTVDDMNANSISRGGRSEVTPNLETVAEVRVVANNFSAVQGRNMGAQVSVVTKSGTNEFHGAIWEYHRNNVLQSRNLFQSKVPVKPLQSIRHWCRRSDCQEPHVFLLYLRGFAGHRSYYRHRHHRDERASRLRAEYAAELSGG